jgi:hypothetical protein
MHSWWDFFDSSCSSKFWWTKSWLWSAHEVFLLSPKSCANSWSNSGDRELDLGELTRGLLFIPSCPGLTGLIGAEPLRVLFRVNILVCSLLSCVSAVSGLESFGAREVGFLELGFPGSNWSDQ